MLSCGCFMGNVWVFCDDADSITRHATYGFTPKVDRRAAPERHLLASCSDGRSDDAHH
jgi:hypothetical protein